MEEPYYEETWFYVPERVWQELVDDEEPDLEPAESVLDDIILFEVG